MDTCRLDRSSTSRLYLALRNTVGVGARPRLDVSIIDTFRLSGLRDDRRNDKRDDERDYKRDYKRTRYRKWGEPIVGLRGKG